MNPDQARAIAERIALQWAQAHAGTYLDESGAALFGQACAAAFRAALLELEREYPAAEPRQGGEVPPSLLADISAHVARMREVMDSWNENPWR